MKEHEINIEISETKAACHLSITGSVTLEKLGAIKRTIEKNFSDSRKVVIDLLVAGEVHFSLLPLLCSVHRSASMRGMSVELKSVSGDVKNMLCRVGYQGKSGCEKVKGACLWEMVHG